MTGILRGNNSSKVALNSATERSLTLEREIPSIIKQDACGVIILVLESVTATKAESFRINDFCKQVAAPCISNLLLLSLQKLDTHAHMEDNNLPFLVGFKEISKR